MSHEELMTFSEQITEFGKALSKIDEEFEFPGIPMLGIDACKMTIQRFLYWNFLKCFWNPELGYHNSLMTNFDWYSPAQAFRYSEQEFKEWITREKMDEIHFHREHACYSGRFRKPISSHSL